MTQFPLSLLVRARVESPGHKYCTPEILGQRREVSWPGFLVKMGFA